MSNLTEQMMLDFLADTEPHINSLDELSYETAVELYDLLDVIAVTSTSNIKTIINPFFNSGHLGRVR